MVTFELGTFDLKGKGKLDTDNGSSQFEEGLRVH